MNVDNPILGAVVTDKLTGIRGVATAVTHYLHGTSRVLVESTNADDNLREYWFDQSRVTPSNLNEV